MDKDIEISMVLEELYNISGFRISIHGTDFNEIAAYPPDIHPFCRLVQSDKSVKKNCLRCDSNAFFQARKTGKPCFYRCNFGLCEAVAPLYHFGVLSGFLMMGQVRAGDSDDKENLILLASEYIRDRNAIERAVNLLPVIELKQIESYVNIMTICAEYITLSGKLSPPSKGFTARVREYINANYAKKITLDGLCSHFKCSKSTLMTSFKMDCYQTVVNYITDVRMEHALKMLENDSDTINDIAIACGFCDQCYFSKQFSKKYGMTPSKYRRDFIKSNKQFPESDMKNELLAERSK